MHSSKPGQATWLAKARLTLELRAGDYPSLVLVQADNRVRVGLAHVKTVVAALADAAANLAEVLGSGGGYHRVFSRGTRMQTPYTSGESVG
jgi:hypothetical protein